MRRPSPLNELLRKPLHNFRSFSEKTFDVQKGMRDEGNYLIPPGSFTYSHVAYEMNINFSSNCHIRNNPPPHTARFMIFKKGKCFWHSSHTSVTLQLCVSMNIQTRNSRFHGFATFQTFFSSNFPFIILQSTQKIRSTHAAGRIYIVL